MSKIHLPTVTFQLPTISREAGVLTTFLHPGPDGWKKNEYIYARHPELELLLRETTNPEQTFKICFKYVKEFRSRHASEFVAALKKNQALWRPVEKKYLETLSTHFETDFPARRKVMRAYVSLIPIYPRWLDEWSFNVSYFVPERVREIACHEIQHFLYFKKWLEVFPKTKHEQFNSPHLVWRLSELIDPVILNGHPEFKKLFNKKQLTYKHFQKIRINGKQPTTHLAIIYRKHLRSGTPFDEFLREIWQFARDNEKVLMSA